MLFGRAYNARLPVLFGISLSDVGGPANAPRKVAFSRCSASSLPNETGKDFMADTEGLIVRDKYSRLMVLFQSNWASLELTTDFGIGRFLNITHEQCHLITSGMMFGGKVQLLASLLQRSDDPKKDAVLEAFNKLRGQTRYFRAWLCQIRLR